MSMSLHLTSRRRLLAGLAATLWAIALAVAATSVIASRAVAPVSLDRPIPTLTAADRVDAERLASGELTRLVGAGGFAIGDVGVWHTHGRQKLGAIVVAAARGPRSFHARWPLIDYDRSETSAQGYADDTAEFTASNVDEFLVLVDLRRGRVVQVEPNGSAVTVTDVVGNLRRRDKPLGD
jgi:hypothetical protein